MKKYISSIKTSFSYSCISYLKKKNLSHALLYIKKHNLIILTRSLEKKKNRIMKEICNKK
jgi:hypothetical protein